MTTAAAQVETGDGCAIADATSGGPKQELVQGVVAVVQVATWERVRGFEIGRCENAARHDVEIGRVFRDEFLHAFTETVALFRVPSGFEVPGRVMHQDRSDGAC